MPAVPLDLQVSSPAGTRRLTHQLAAWPARVRVAAFRVIEPAVRPSAPVVNVSVAIASALLQFALS